MGLVGAFDERSAFDSTYPVVPFSASKTTESALSGSEELNDGRDTSTESETTDRLGGTALGFRDRGGPGAPGAAICCLTATRYFPESELSNVRAIAECESNSGRHPNTYRLEGSGGIMQIHRPTWERFFLGSYGWEWEEIVFNDERNLEAAFIIWQRAGNSWTPWDCSFVVK